MKALKSQTEGSAAEVGAKEEKSAFLTYLLSQTDLTTTEVIANCIDLMLAAVDTVCDAFCCPLLLLCASDVGVRRTAMSVSVCLSVCLPARISRKPQVGTLQNYL